jgi:TatD DNase family protein
VTSTPLELIDTHAHLDDRQFDEDRNDVLARAIEAGVRTIVNIGYRPGVWETTIALAARVPLVKHTLGLHPHHAELWSDQTEATLRRLVAETKPLAIGEIGLDLYRNMAPLDVQLRAFREQAAIAYELGLPIVIHQRAAEAELIPELEKLPERLRCILHSFEGSPALANLAIERGDFVGAGGLMTRSRAQSVRDALLAVPLEQILIETDSPYLAPAKVKNQRNEPANLPRIAAALADLYGHPVDSIARTTTANAKRAFSLLLSATS